jgi:hypothetical protein
VLELPALERFSRDAALQGVRVVTLVSGEEAPKASELLSRLPYRFPVVMDSDSRISAAYKVAAVPQTVIIKNGQITARFVGDGPRAGLADTLRAETGVAEVEDAGGTGEAPMALAERDGRYVATEESAKGWSVPINRGKWTRMSDGPYLDPASGEVVVTASARGPAFTAGNAATTHASAVWRELVAAGCPASARITPANLESLGAFAAAFSAAFPGWPREQLAAQMRPCESQTAFQLFVAPFEAGGAQRALLRYPADTFVYETLERWRDSKPGETRPPGPQLKNHFADVKAKLKAEGRILAEPLR